MKTVWIFKSVDWSEEGYYRTHKKKKNTSVGIKENNCMEIFSFYVNQIYLFI